MTTEQIIDDLQFVCQEVFNNTIPTGPCAREIDPSRAIAAIQEIARYLHEVKQEATHA